MKYIVDRFEGDYAVCQNQETGEMEDIDLIFLPPDVKENDVLVYDEDWGEFLIDEEETSEVLEEIRERMDNLWE